MKAAANLSFAVGEMANQGVTVVDTDYNGSNSIQPSTAATTASYLPLVLLGVVIAFML